MGNNRIQNDLAKEPEDGDDDAYYRIAGTTIGSMVIGGTIGSGIGGPVGTAVGAAVGGILGFGISNHETQTK